MKTCYRKNYKMEKKEEDINLSLRQEGKVFILGPKVFLTGI